MRRNNVISFTPLRTQTQQPSASIGISRDDVHATEALERPNDPIPPFVGECIGTVLSLSMGSQNLNSVNIVDLLNWIGSPIRFPPGLIVLHCRPKITDLLFVFVAFFIRAYLWGASFGARLSGKHRPVIALVIAWVR